MALLDAQQIKTYQVAYRNALSTVTLSTLPVLFDRIVTYHEVDSTNLRVKEDMRVRSHDVCACVHTALVQTQGYGRQGRSWTSPLGGLYASVGIDLAQVLPTPLRDDVATLSLVVGLSVKAALDEVTNLSAQDIHIKWPNDVLVNEAKICGISLELFNSTMLCIGIGINVVRDEASDNVAHTDAKYPYAYACDEVHVPGEDLSKEQIAFMETLLGCVLAHLEVRFALWLEQGFAPFVDQFNDCLAWKGRCVQIEYVDGRPLDSGIISTVTKRGTLLLEQPNQATCAEVASGEVHFLPLA